MNKLAARGSVAKLSISSCFTRSTYFGLIVEQFIEHVWRLSGIYHVIHLQVVLLGNLVETPSYYSKTVTTIDCLYMYANGLIVN